LSGRKSVDEDDFIAASGEESDVPVPSDTVASEDDDEPEEEEEAPKTKGKKKAAPKASKSKASSSAAAATSFAADHVTSTEGMFLTKAEQRVQGKKDDKKANEECYSFLKNIKDVRWPICRSR